MEYTVRERAYSLTEPLFRPTSDFTESETTRESHRLPCSAPGTPRGKKYECHRFGTEVLVSSRGPRRLMAELQIETVSTGTGRVFLYSWYAVLILALALQSVLSLQWKMTNICGANEENLDNIDSWNSPCVHKYLHLPTIINWTDYAVDAHLYTVPTGLLSGSAIGKEKRSDDDDDTPTRHLYNLRWVGTGDGTVLDVKLNRFVRVVLSMASPQENLPKGLERKWYPLRVALKESPISPPDNSSSDSSSSSDLGDRGNNEGSSLAYETTFLYNTSTLCFRSSSRCSAVVLPDTVVVAANGSRITLSIFDVDEELGNVSSSSAVGIVFQRASYTIGTIVCRYTFLFLSILNLIRFVYRKRFSKTLYEQYWMMFLHLALYLYLDPVFAAGIYDSSGNPVYQFIEFRIPTYFAAFLSCFIFALIVISIDWCEHYDIENLSPEKQHEVPAENTGGTSSGGPLPLSSFPGHTNCRSVDPPSSSLSPIKQEQQHHRLVSEEEGCYSANVHSRCGSFEALRGVRPICATRGSMPFWAKLTLVNYSVAILSLDIAQAYVRGWGWGAEVGCAYFSCLYVQYLMYGVMLLFMLACCILLIRLHLNLGKRPYLETRPQQLACRVFIFVFSTALIYFVVQVVLIALLYSKIIGVASYQPFTQVSPVIVSTFFVNHMTFVYTTTVASSRVPIRPDNPRWRHVIWSREWYRWLELHGGILYIFHNERQERNFMWLQNKNKISAIKSLKVEFDGDRNAPLLETGKGTRLHTTGGCSSSNASTKTVMNAGLSYSLYDALQGEEEETNNEGPSSEEYYTEEDENINVNVNNSAEGAPDSQGTLSIKKEVLSFLQKAERHLIDRPGTIIDRLEEALVDPLQSLWVRGSGRMPFFNLETAIDCLNLSWEAYVTNVNQVTDPVSSNNVGFPLRYVSNALYSTLSYCAPCCLSLNDEEEEEEDGTATSTTTTTTTTVAATTPTTAIASGNYNNNVDDRSKSDVVVEYTDATPTMGEGEGALLSPPPPPPPPPPAPSSKTKMCTERYGYNQIAVFHGRDVQVVITVMDATLSCHHRKHPRIVIAFRGTDNISNAREDLRFHQRTWREIDRQRQWSIGPKAKVHTGFLNIWISLKESVLRTLRAYLHAHPSTVYSIFCTGHSLGGALACLCAYSVRKMLRLMEYPLPEVTVYTFGQPPLGNKAFQIAYNRAIPRTFRVVNESDAVSLIGMYGCHIGIEVDIDRHGNYICKPMFIERLFRPTKGKGFAVVNHTLAAYAVSLNAVAVRHTGGACTVRCLEAYVDCTTPPTKSESPPPPPPPSLSVA